MSDASDELGAFFVWALILIVIPWIMYPYDGFLKWQDKAMIFPAVCSGEFEDGDCKGTEIIEAPYSIYVNFANSSVTLLEHDNNGIITFNNCEIFDLNNFNCSGFSFRDGDRVPFESGNDKTYYSISEWKYKFYYWETHFNNKGKWL